MGMGGVLEAMFSHFHPFVGPPLVFAVGTLVAMFVFMADQAAGLALLLIFGLPGLAYAAFLLTLLAMGMAACRDEGPRQAPDGEDVRQPGAMVADRLHLCACDLAGGAYQTDTGRGARPVTVLMGQCPGRKRKGDQRDMKADLEELRNTYEVDLVVTLVEQRELDVMDCAGMGADAERLGMGWLHFPVRDKWIPYSTDSFIADVVAPVVSFLTRPGLVRRNVFVHCNGGKGRTGLLAAALLLTRSLSSMNLHSIACLSGLPNPRACKAAPTCTHATQPPLRAPANPTQSITAAVEAVRFARPGLLTNPLQQWYLAYIRRRLLDL